MARDGPLLLLSKPPLWSICRPCECSGCSTGDALTALGLPLDGGPTSKTEQLSSFIAAFNSIFASQTADVSTLAGIQTSLTA